MKIVDCFIFHDELDLLYYRMKILNNVVDYFVICESTKTFVGNDKPLLFIENKHRFNEFANKIVYIKVSNFSSNSKYAWDNENCQRRHLDIGIQSLKLGDNDHVFISDLNEIPDPSVLEWIKSTDQQLDFVACFPMDSYYYNLTTKISKSWNYAAVMSFRHYKTSCNPQELRFTYPRRPVSSNGSRCGSGWKGRRGRGSNRNSPTWKPIGIVWTTGRPSRKANLWAVGRWNRPAGSTKCGSNAPASSGAGQAMKCCCVWRPSVAMGAGRSCSLTPAPSTLPKTDLRPSSTFWAGPAWRN